MPTSLLSAIIVYSLGQMPDGIAKEYDTVVAKYAAAVKAAGESQGAIAIATSELSVELSDLLKRGEAVPDGQLSCEDLIALSKAAERLNNGDVSFKFARSAVQIADRIDAYTMVVRRLCDRHLVQEAETEIIEAHKRFPKDEKLYLLHNVLALEYTHLGELTKAFDHMSTTATLVCEQVEQGPFYVLHIEHCIDQLMYLGVAIGKTADVQSILNHCFERVDALRRASVRRAKGDSNPDSRGSSSPDDWIKLRRTCQSLVAVELRREGGNPEAILEDWVKVLNECHGAASFDIAVWCEEIAQVTKECEAALSPGAAGVRIRKCLDEVVSLLNDEGTASVEIRRATLARVERVRAIIEEHVRHRELVGKQLVLYKQWNERPRAELELLHVCDPLSQTCRQGVLSVQAASDKLDESQQVKVRFVMVQNSLSSSDTRIMTEARKKIGLLKEVDVVTRESPEWRQLASTYLPLNILVDGTGTVIEVAAGPQRQKCEQVFRRATEVKR